MTHDELRKLAELALASWDDGALPAKLASGVLSLLDELAEKNSALGEAAEALEETRWAHPRDADWFAMAERALANPVTVAALADRRKAGSDQ